MFTWICPQCGREVPPAYDACPDCAAKAAAGAGVATAPPQSQAAAPPPGPRGARRPLWATGPQEPLPPAPPPAFVPPPPVPMAELPPEAPPVFRPAQPASPMFQPAAPVPVYQVPQPSRPPSWLMGGAIVVIIGVVVGAIYWFFLRPQPTSAVIEAPAAKSAAAGENPLQKYIEVSGLRFSPISKGVQVSFVLINHSDSDVLGLTGTATVVAKTDSGQEQPVGSVKFQTTMPAQSSKELQLPFDTKLKLMEMPDWQNVSVKVQITSPPGA